MSSPATPTASFVGGVGLALSVHALAVYNGSVLGCSGFIHRTFKREYSNEALMGTAGLVGAGCLGALLGRGTPVLPSSSGKALDPVFLLSGLLVGLGSKLQNGCTSGHMLSGVSRGSLRSIVATGTFFCTAMATASLKNGPILASSRSLEWTLQSSDKNLILAQALPLAVYVLGRQAIPGRLLASFCTSFSFGLALLLSNLYDPYRVLNFLVTPLSKAFDPSLAFLAVGALPLLTLLTFSTSGDTAQPINGGKRTIPASSISRNITSRLLLGAVIFGIGWGLSGVCPGPVAVGLGNSIVNSSFDTALQLGSWLAAMSIGGKLA